MGTSRSGRHGLPAARYQPITDSTGPRPDSAATNLTYDLAGRKTGMTYPDMRSWSYAYDAAGNLTRQTDARNQTTCLYYDGLNRLKGKTYRGDTNCPGDPGYGSYTIKNYYDRDENNTAVANGLGRRTVLLDDTGVTRWLYDQRGRVTQETRVISGASGGTFVTKWDYDSADRPKWQKYPADNTRQVGEQVAYGYNAAGGLTSVVGQATYVSSTTYDAAGRPWALFQVQLFLNDLQALIEAGWEAPPDLNIGSLQCLASGTENCPQ